MSGAERGAEPGNDVAVWDRVVRGCHWTLVGACVVAYVVEDGILALHLLAGAVAFGAVGVRLVWAFRSGGHAGLRGLWATPGEAIAYIRRLARGDAPRHVGHSPAGAFMATVLMVLVAVVTLTGVVAWLEDASAWDEAHELSVNVLLLAVIAHLTGVFIASLVHGENLSRAMWTGRKRP